jgi:hydrophobic/amphiphilic exporter-1 (mainly G- bacteria), HAE1 family
MVRFALRRPYVILVACLLVTVLGAVSLARMPVDLFPSINIPEVVVATFYNGMPPKEVEGAITSRFERFFTLGSGIDLIESRSLEGVSIIKVHFQPGTSADADVAEIANLAAANLRRLPAGTLPPVVLKFDASSLPVCLVTLKGQGLSETEIHDAAQFAVRDQLAYVPGTSVPPPFGGKYRQIMVYVDPSKLEAHGLGVMDVVRAVNQQNLILPSGDVKIGRLDYPIYINNQIPDTQGIDAIPLKTVGMANITVGDIGEAKDAAQIQTNVVRVDGQPSVYVPIMKQGGDTNTLSVVNGVKATLAHLVDVPKSLETQVVADESLLIKSSISTLIHEGLVGLLLTCLIIWLVLGTPRGMLAAALSFVLAALASFLALGFGGSTLNIMVLAGLALSFSRVIQNSVIVLENIHRHRALGSSPLLAAEEGGRELVFPLLAATVAAAVVFFPVVFLTGVSKYLFSALALAVVLAVFASYFISVTVVPLFCAKFMFKAGTAENESQEAHAKSEKVRSFLQRFKEKLESVAESYERLLRKALRRPRMVVISAAFLVLASLLLLPAVNVSYFPRTDAGQFVINVKAPLGTRLEVTTQDVQKVESIVRQTVQPQDLGVIVSNVGVAPGFSAIYSSNAATHDAFIQVGLREEHHVSSFQYMREVREKLASEVPALAAYVQSGGLVNSVLTSGAPAPIDVQVSGPDLDEDFAAATQIARQARELPGVSDIYIPEDVDYPALRLDINRLRAAQLGLTEHEVSDNIISALSSNGMIAPAYWIDPRTGLDYLLTVQYPESQVKDTSDLLDIPLRTSEGAPVLLDAVATLRQEKSPTEVDHHQLRRVIDVYVAPSGEDIRKVANAVEGIVHRIALPGDVQVDLRGVVETMRTSFRSFGFGLFLSVGLLYLLLVAQFSSFSDPLIVLLTVPLGLIGVIVALLVTGSGLNIMSLMGTVMLVDLAAANGILIVELADRLGKATGRMEAIIQACRIRMRPIVMTSIATAVGLLPMALKIGATSEAYAPLAWSIIGGLLFSVPLSAFVLPAAYILFNRGHALQASAPADAEVP